MKVVYLVIGTENDNGWAFDKLEGIFESLKTAQDVKAALELEDVYDDVRIERWDVN